MFAKETRAEIVNIIKFQQDELKSLKEISSSKTDFDTNDFGYGYEGDKKTIFKSAQANSAKLAYSAQSCLFQLLQQIDAFRDQVASTQKRREPANMSEILGIFSGFLSSTKAIRGRDEFKEILGSKN